jgi:hypothetical protein
VPKQSQWSLQRISAGPIVQIAWAVDDIDAAVDHWVRAFGVGPFFVFRHVEMKTATYRNKPFQFDHSAAFAQWGSFQVELMQQHGSYPSMLRDVCPAGETKVVSYSWFVDDLVEETARLNALGFETAYTGLDAQLDIRAAWFDTQSVLGAMAEVYQENPIMRIANKKIADASEGWNGKRPLRGFEELQLN